MEAIIRKRGFELIDAGYTVVPSWGLVEDGEGWRCACGRPQCMHPGKHPWTPRGRVIYAEKAADWDQVCLEAAYHDTPLNLAVAVGTRRGENGCRFGVIDIDEGVEPLYALLDERGISDADRERLAPTPTERSSRGWHIFVRFPDGYEKIPTIAALGGKEGLELKGDKALIHVAPSRHVSGTPYAAACPLERPILPLWPELLEIVEAKVEEERRREREGLSFRCEPGEIRQLAAALGPKWLRRLGSDKSNEGYVGKTLARARYDLLTMSDGSPRTDGRKRAINTNALSIAQLHHLGLVSLDAYHKVFEPPEDGRWGDLVASGYLATTLARALQDAREKPRRQSKGFLVELVSTARQRGIAVPRGLDGVVREGMSEAAAAAAVGASAPTSMDENTFWALMQALAALNAHHNNAERLVSDLRREQRLDAVLTELAERAAVLYGAPGADPWEVLYGQIGLMSAPEPMSRERALVEIARTASEYQARQAGNSESARSRSGQPETSRADAQLHKEDNMEQTIDSETLRNLLVAHARTIAALEPRMVDLEDANSYLATVRNYAPELEKAVVAGFAESLPPPYRPDAHIWCAHELANLANAQREEAPGKDASARFRSALAFTAEMLNLPPVEISPEETIDWILAPLEPLPVPTSPERAAACLLAKQHRDEAIKQLATLLPTLPADWAPLLEAWVRDYSPAAGAELGGTLQERAAATTRRLESDEGGERSALRSFALTLATYLGDAHWKTLEEGCAAMAVAFPAATAAALGYLETKLGGAVSPETWLAAAAMRELEIHHDDVALHANSARRDTERLDKDLAGRHRNAIEVAIDKRSWDIGPRTALREIDNVNDRVAAATAIALTAGEATDTEVSNVLGEAIRTAVDSLRPTWRDAEEWRSALITRAWEKRATFDPLRGTLRSWVYTLGRGVTRDAVRETEAELSIDTTPGLTHHVESRAAAPSAEESALEDMDRKRQITSINSLLRLLPRQEREAVRYTYLAEGQEALKQAETAIIEQMRFVANEAIYELRNNPMVDAAKRFKAAVDQGRLLRDAYQETVGYLMTSRHMSNTSAGMTARMGAQIVGYSLKGLETTPSLAMPTPQYDMSR